LINCCIIFQQILIEEVCSVMEIILIHKPIGTLSPDTATAGLQLGRNAVTKPGEVVPGGKLIASYYARALWLIVCIWDVPNVEALMPFVEQLMMLGWNTEIIPAEKGEVAVEKIAKALGL
jgi:hypothetical protein